MNDDIKFQLEDLTDVYRGIERYAVLIVLKNGIPVDTYILKLPDPYLRCHLGPITLN